MYQILFLDNDYLKSDYFKKTINDKGWKQPPQKMDVFIQLFLFPLKRNIDLDDYELNSIKYQNYTPPPPLHYELTEFSMWLK